MDGRHVEPGLRLSDGVSGLHELLRDAYGGSIAGDGAPRLFGRDT